MPLFILISALKFIFIFIFCAVKLNSTFSDINIVTSALFFFAFADILLFIFNIYYACYDLFL